MGCRHRCRRQRRSNALLEFDHADEAEAFAAFETVLERGWVTDGVISQSDAQAQALWALREGITESIAPYTPYKNDLAVRISDVPGFLSDVDRVVAENYPDWEICWFGHIGDGNLHLNVLKPPDLDMADFLRALPRDQPEAVRTGPGARRQHLRRTRCRPAQARFLEPTPEAPWRSTSCEPSKRCWIRTG